MDKPWWYPELTDEKWIARIREDYPDDADCDDETLRENYADGRKYATLWDHTGEAYEQFEKLADAYLERCSEVAQLQAAMVEQFKFDANLI